MKSLLLHTLDKFGIYPLFNKYTRNTATVFMLHRFAPAGANIPDFLSADLLAKFLDYLKRSDYNVISLSEYVDALAGGRETHKAVVFTVDDGYRDFYDHAFGVFRQFDSPAAIFLTGDFIEGKLFFWWDTLEFILNRTGQKEFDLAFLEPQKCRIDTPEAKAELLARVTEYCKSLENKDKLELIRTLGGALGVTIPQSPPEEYAPLSWNQIAEMQLRGIEFFPHTMTHPILSKVPVEQQREEVLQSRLLLENHLKTKCDIFCYPNGGPGDFTEETIEALKSAGYRAAVVGIPGFDLTTKPTDMFRIRRFSIPPNEMLFKQYVCGLENFKNQVSSRR